MLIASLKMGSNKVFKHYFILHSEVWVSIPKNCLRSSKSASSPWLKLYDVIVAS